MLCKTTEMLNESVEGPMLSPHLARVLLRGVFPHMVLILGCILLLVLTFALR